MSFTNATLLFEWAAAKTTTGESMYEVIEVALGATLSVERRRIHPQLYALSALLGAELVCLGASLATRFRTREVWFWRWQETGNGVYLAPHFNLPWQAVALLFLIVLQGDVWCLYKLSNGHRIKGFYVVESVVWSGFWLSALVCTWSVAVSRAIQVSNSATRLRPELVHRPYFVHTLFIGYCFVIIVASFAWAGVTERRYELLNAAAATALATLAQAAAANASSSNDATQLQGAIAAVQGALDAAAEFLWAWRTTFWVGMGHNMFTFVICNAVALPFITRMWLKLWRPLDGRVLAPAERIALLWALVTASTTMLAINVACILYAVLVLIMVIKAQPGNFIPLAYSCGLAGLWIFAALGLLVCSVALLRSRLQCHEERQQHAPVAARAQEWTSTADGADGDAGGTSEAGGRRKRSKLERTLGYPAGAAESRFVVSISRTDDEAGESRDGVEGERVELAEVGKEGWGR